MTEQTPNLDQLWEVETVRMHLQDQLWEVETVRMHLQESNSILLNTYQDSSIYQLPNGMYCTKFP